MAKLFNTYVCLIAIILAIILSLVSCKQAQNSDSNVLLAEIDNAIEHRQISQADSLITFLTRNYRFPNSWKRQIYSRIAAIADHSEEYDICLKYLDKMGKGKTDEAEQILALSKLPEMTYCMHDSIATLEYILDSLFYKKNYCGCEIRVPVDIGGVQDYCVLDNGSSDMCYASESFAETHSIRNTGIICHVIDNVSRSSSWIGLADTLYVGPVEFHNVKFSILPDSSIPEIAGMFNATIGSNLLRACGEICFDNKSCTLTFRKSYEPLKSNLKIGRNGSQYIDAVVQGDTLQFLFDLGTANTVLNSSFLRKYKDMSYCPADSVMMMAATGMRKEMVYTINDMTLEACGGKYRLKNASVYSSSHPGESTEFGTIGNDFLLSFDRAILNLDKLYFYITHSPFCGND